MDNLPYIPEIITVHLGSPGSSAENVGVSFPDYIKNVASSEIYPSWPEEALRANIYAQISFALNRVYTEYYRSRGYDFDITNDTSIDQSFINGRNIFKPINDIVDGIFNNYISRRGFVEPLFAQYCNGTTVTCAGLSQWGSVDLAEEGLIATEILAEYYGNNIRIVRNAPVQGIVLSAPIRPLQVGSAGNQVYFVQLRLNRISVNYPSIPKIPEPTGLFDVATENAVLEFQRIFYLETDGIVGKKTWYRIVYVFNSVKKLSELDSEGLTLGEVTNQFPEVLKEGDRGNYVTVIQYMLALVARYVNTVPEIAIDGIYGPETAAAVSAFQQSYGIEPTGVMDAQTYANLYDVYAGIISSLPESDFQSTARPYPGYALSEGSEGEYVKALQEYLNEVGKVIDQIPPLEPDGIYGPLTTEAVRAFQRAVGLDINGIAGASTWIELANLYNSIQAGEYLNPGQFPGFDVTQEASNEQ
ncbi:MAG: peptidoglycan-binding protein [Firmicutes bacterium]|nr:peptidoglycan-binding protein [Bacillota bacterium]